MAPGLSCDDGNPATTNEVYDAQCGCSGEPVPEICDGYDNDGDGTIDE